MRLILISLLFFSTGAFAARVVFIEIQDSNGNRIELEPGARFAHVAIQYGEYWLHAHSHKGVDLVTSEELAEYGSKFTYLGHPRLQDPDRHSVSLWVGKPFDFTYSWSNSLATYCTRLVAEVLGLPISPRPMSFVSPLWQKHLHRPIGEPGLSPDELFEELLNNFDFELEAIDCEASLTQEAAQSA